ncbi:hypothetical protein ACOSQ4_011966 [Xanthoceras sorbifolium]
MPLARFSVRNEYGLGQPQLYTQANKEDSKVVLDEVAVAGLRESVRSAMTELTVMGREAMTGHEGTTRLTTADDDG